MTETENFSKASGWPSAAAILDAAAKMQLLSFESGSVSEKPSHEFRILRQGKPTVEVRFYVSDLQAPEMKAVISGYDFIFKVSRNFFESIFVPAAPPQEEKFIV